MVFAPASGGRGSSGKEPGNVPQGESGFLSCCLRRMVFSVFADTAAIGAVDRKRADSGIDGISDRTAKRYCDPVFLLWGNTVGDCKGTWYYTAHGFSDAHGSASPDAGQSERQFLRKKSGFQRRRCAVCGVNVQRSGDVMYFAQVTGLWWKLPGKSIWSGISPGGENAIKRKETENIV